MRRFPSLSACLFLAVATAANPLPAQTPSFAAPKQISAASWAFYGNFDGNGNTDMITHVYSSTAGTFHYEFLTGDGTGNFSDSGAAFDFPQQGANVDLVADVNGDGKDDVIDIVPGCPTAPCSNNPNDPQDLHGAFAVFLSQGNGKFTQGYSVTLPPGLDDTASTVADFNKDGKPDIAVLAYAYGGKFIATPAELIIFLNQGNGSFAQNTYQVPENFWSSNPIPTNLVSGDFEGNGNLDLAFAFYSSYGAPVPDPEILTFAGNGKGGFGPGVVSYTLDSRVYNFGSLFAADLNVDGRTDLLMPLNSTIAGGNLRVPSLLAENSGRFYWESAIYMGFQGTDPANVLLDDFNGDGKPDLFFFGGQPNTPPGQAGFYLGLGNGGFKTPHIPLALNVLPGMTVVTAIHLKTGDLPSLLVENNQTVDLLVNTTKK